MKVSELPANAKERCSLLCVSSEFGLTFIGCNNGMLPKLHP